MTDVRGPTITCPRGHVVATGEVISRGGLLVCPFCDGVEPAVAGGSSDDIDVWRRPGSAPPPPPPPSPAPPATPVHATPVPAAPLAEPALPVASVASVEEPTDELPAPAAGAPPAPVEAVVVAPRSRLGPLLQAPLALIAVSIVVTLASSCFFVAEAIDLSDAGDVGGAARLTGTILAAAGNLVLALAVAWIVVLLGRSSRGT